MTGPEDLLHKQMEGRLTAAEGAELERWLREDPEHMKHFVRWCTAFLLRL